MKKFCCLLLGLILALSVLASCKGNDGKGEVTTAPAESEDEVWEVAVKDMGGRTFNILSAEGDYGLTLLDVPELTADSVESSVFSRNRDLESRLNIVIQNEEIVNTGVELAARIRQLSSTNDYAFDAYVGQGSTIMGLATEGCYADVSALGNSIDLSQSWWDEAVTDQLSLNGKLYPLVGKAILHFYESTNVMVYNSDYAKTLSMPSFVEQAKEGEWTWENVHIYSEQARQDLNSNSAKDGEDQFGFTVGHNMIQVALACAGETVVTYDEQNYPSFTGFSSRTVDIYDNIVEWFYKTDDTFIAPRDNSLLTGTGMTTFHDLFSQNRALFYMEPVGSLQKLRDSTFEFTVLPTPKYVADDVYRTNVVKYASLMFIPSGAPDKEDLGLFLENWMYSSSKTVFPEYVERIVNLQRVRNAESYYVLTEIVWKSETVVNMFYLYDWGSLATSLIDYAKEGKSIVTLGQSLSRSMGVLIEKSIGPKSGT